VRVCGCAIVQVARWQGGGVQGSGGVAGSMRSYEKVRRCGAAGVQGCGVRGY
jgi:hypothetical protein